MIQYLQEFWQSITGGIVAIGQAQGFTEIVTAVNNVLNNLLWGVPMLLLILIVGIWMTYSSGAVQIRKFGYAMKNTLGKMFKQKKAEEGAITPFEAVSTALAATVGTGNIAGVAGAITIGGPGAVFWMWVSALVGMATKYAEIVLAVNFRERDAKGEWVGGPMYYIKKGLGKGWGWLASLFCVLGALAAFGIGNMTQINSIVGSVDDLIVAFGGYADRWVVHLIVGVALAIIVAIVLFGGTQRIAKATSMLVPIMAVLYFIGGIVFIIFHAKNVGPAFADIFAGAFGMRAFVGGSAGYLIANAMKQGFSRGIFSNEAGLGSAPIAHASADVKHPVEQGIYGILEVFLDTFVVCTISALIILCSGMELEYGVKAGASLTTAALGSFYGQKVASVFMFVALGCFAFSTVLGWSLYGSRCVGYLFGNTAVIIYQIVFVGCVVVAAMMELSLAWAIADTLNAAMAIPNMIALIALGGTVGKLTKEYFAKA